MSGRPQGPYTVKKRNMVLAQPFMPGVLEAHVVVVGEAVVAVHGVAFAQQQFGQVVADEAGGAGDEEGTSHVCLGLNELSLLPLRLPYVLLQRLDVFRQARVLGTLAAQEGLRGCGALEDGQLEGTAMFNS